VPEYNDYPLNDLAKTVYAVMRQGGVAYLKFTCSYCKSRQTIDVPNQLFTEGKCEECKSVTDIAKQGGNLLIVQRLANDAV
jgi:phage FluMu protein Com